MAAFLAKPDKVIAEEAAAAAAAAEGAAGKDGAAAAVKDGCEHLYEVGTFAQVSAAAAAQHTVCSRT